MSKVYRLQGHQFRMLPLILVNICRVAHDIIRREAGFINVTPFGACVFIDRTK